MSFDKDGFTKLVQKLRDEFIKKDGYVTCEFSTGKAHLPEKLEILNENSIGTDELCAIWQIFHCDTCKGYNEETPYHVILMQTLSSKDHQFKALYNLEKRKNQRLEQELQEKEDIIQNNIIIDKNSFKTITDEAMKNFEHKSIHDVPDCLLSSSEIADNIA